MDQIILLFVVVAAVALAVTAWQRLVRRKGDRSTAQGSKVDIGARLDELLPPQFIVADIETTGLDSEEHEIIEIAAIKVNSKSSNHLTFSALVKPSRKISKKITEITGITNEMLQQEGESIEKVMGEFLDFVGDLRIVFYNAPFDRPFLTKAARKVNRTLSNRVSDALDMARRVYPGMPSYKLSELASVGGMDVSGAHRALKDCRMTIIVYTSCVARLRRLQ